MKALTIRQPWAEAILAGHKEVENRPTRCTRIRHQLSNGFSMIEGRYRDSSDEIITTVWHWLLQDIHALDEPIPCRGRLGLWNTPNSEEFARFDWLYGEED